MDFALKFALDMWDFALKFALDMSSLTALSKEISTGKAPSRQGRCRPDRESAV